MTHELKHIIETALLHQQKGLKSILATVVDLDGSSYRKPGVRMLICENGTMTGAVSGGCIEKDILHQSQSVFKDGIPKIMTYDGRYRLGCEGLLYILIEPFYVSENLKTTFSSCLENRQHFKINAYYKKNDATDSSFGSAIQFDNNLNFYFRDEFNPKNRDALTVFSQTLKPSHKLLIFGGEHDAVKLCAMASFIGWDVEVVTSIKDPKLLSNFPGAKSVIAQSPELMMLNLDQETSIVLMNHNYVLDLKYLIKLATQQTKYIGILGSSRRREKLKNELFDYVPEVESSFLDSIYSPTGLDIGAVTPEEIALSILSEILSVVNKTSTQSLRVNRSKLEQK